MDLFRVLINETEFSWPSGINLDKRRFQVMDLFRVLINEYVEI